MTDAQRTTRTRRGVSRADVLMTCLAIIVITAASLTAMAESRRRALGTRSNANLVTLGFGHAMYADDWNGRQYTLVNDDISTYGESLVAFNAYNAQVGEQHPAILLGWGFNGNVPVGPPVLFAYRCDGNLSNASLTLPVHLATGGATAYLGAFRLPNSRGFRQYVAARFYSDPFYSPNDLIALETVEPLMEFPWEYADLPPVLVGGDLPAWSSYCMSPAAMFHPDVMRHPDDGGFQDPWSLDHGFASPGLFAARHPALKTLMLEHHWLQNAPVVPCNPIFEGTVYSPCEPYYFNHALASAPITLFYDLSVRELPNTEVKAADDGAIARTGSGLWSRDTPWGANGYFNQFGYEEVGLSHHILTTDGILGRDTTAGR